jgi:hypothetical protein
MEHRETQISAPISIENRSYPIPTDSGHSAMVSFQ